MRVSVPKSRIPRNVSPRTGGQAAVEFMLVIIFVMMFFIGFLEIILLIQAYSVLADSAKEGVRYATVHGTLSKKCNGPGDPSNVSLTCDNTNAGVKTTVTNYADHSGQKVVSGDITVSYSNLGGGIACSKPGCGVHVNVSHTYRSFFGLGWPQVTLQAASQGVVTF